MAFNFGQEKRNRQSAVENSLFRQRLRIVEHQNHEVMEQTAKVFNAIERDNRTLQARIKQDNRNLAEKTAQVVHKLERDNRRLQAQIKELRSDKDEMLALRKELRSDKDEMLALRADNELLKTQIAQINALLLGTDDMASK